MKSGQVGNVCHHTAYAGENRSQTDHGMQCSNRLRQFGRSDTTTDDSTYRFQKMRPDRLIESDLPRILPIPATAPNWVRVAGENPTASKEARIPEVTPRIPKILARLAVN